MNDFLLVLTGAGISLVSSVSVTWLQARNLRRSELGASAREATRQLTALFIAERESPAGTSGKESSPNLAEAEMMAAALADRRTRERVRVLIRLLREYHLPELQELSGVKPERARDLLCEHALDVLGAHFRAERVPGLPPEVQKMLDVEDEALNIHAGGGAAKPAGPPGSKSAVRNKPQRKTRSSQTESKETAKKGGVKDTEDSSFWND